MKAAVKPVGCKVPMHQSQRRLHGGLGPAGSQCRTRREYQGIWPPLFRALPCCTLLFLGTAPAQAATPPSSDFASRCAAPGVILCQGFTSPAVLGGVTQCGTTADDISHFQGLDLQDNVCTVPSIDKTTYAPDHTTPGSLKFTFAAGPVDSSSAGAWFTQFSNNFNPNSYFGPGQDFYIQWRQRFDTAFLTTNWTGSGSGGIKQAIIGEGNTCPSCTASNNYPSHVAFACSPMEIVIQDTFGGNSMAHSPRAYHSCGNKDNDYEDFSSNDPANNEPETQNAYAHNLNPPSCEYPNWTNCLRYVANTWMTFQIHVHVSSWYKNDHVYHRDGQFQEWVCTGETGPCTLIVDTAQSDFVLWRSAAGGPGYDYVNCCNNWVGPVDPVAKYGKIYLLPYQTGLTGTIPISANTWYDDLIISTQKIPDPGGTTPPSPCDVNGDGVVNVADVQLEVNMALGISPCTNPSGTCNVTSVQKVVNAALGGSCVAP